MKWKSFGAVLLMAVLWMGKSGKGQTQEKGQTQKKTALPATPKPSDRNPLDSFKTFSATLNGGIGRDHNRKISRSGNLMRMEFDGFYRLTDLETQITWGVEPKTCIQFSAPDAASYPFSAYRDLKVERKLTTEKETVDGHTCAIEEVTYSSADRPFSIKMKLWEAEDLQGFPIKIAVESIGPGGKVGSKLEILYTDVSLGPPDPNLFKRPTKCIPDSAPTPAKSPTKPTGTKKSPQ